MLSPSSAMATLSEKKTKKKTKKKKKEEEEAIADASPAKGKEDLQALRNEIASFASSLGLAAAAAADANSGFDDSDFRKTGPISRSKSKNKDGDQDRDWETEPPQPAVKKQQLRTKPKEPESRRDKALGGVNPPENNSNKRKTGEGFFDPLKLKRAKPDSRQVPERGNGAASQLQESSDATLPKDRSMMSRDVITLLNSAPWYECALGLADSLVQKENQTVEASSMTGKGEGSLLNTIMRNRSNDMNSESNISIIRDVCQQWLETLAAEYENSRGKNSDMKWVLMARRSGTTSDKVAALTVLLQDNTLANLKALDALLGMVTSKGGKRHAAIGIDALKELFLISLLPDRKLKYLEQQQLTSLPNTKEGIALLLLWYWEECLKRRYEKFVESLEEATRDKLPFLKEKSLKTVFELLKGKPEQERRLLSTIVNKLGDPERKVASKAGYLLSCLLMDHPNMKMVVVEEVDSFLFRQNLGLRARYYAAVFLNQIVLSNKGYGPKLAKKLLDIYFAVFKVIISSESEDGRDENSKEHDKRSKKGTKAHTFSTAEHGKNHSEAPLEIDSRLMSALLTGVNRAFPFAVDDDIDILIKEHTPTLFRLVHSKSFNVGVQALLLLHQLLERNQAVSDRFYRVLYGVLFSPELLNSSKLEMFLGLIFKALKSDINSKRIAAFSKRLMQLAAQQPPPFACGCLLMLSEVLKLRPSLWNAVLHPEDEDEDIEKFQDITEEDTIERPSLVSSRYHGDESDENGMAILRTNAEGGMEDQVNSDIDGDDIDCVLSDIGEGDSSSSDEGEAMKSRKAKRTSRMIPEGKVIAEQTCVLDSGTKTIEVKSIENQGWPKEGSYDARNRHPAFCNADHACWWELTALALHVHPSVAAMARTLLSGTNIVYAGDPLRDLSLGVFLDRFAEKKPKSRKKESDVWHGSSLVGPVRKAATALSLPVGSEFLQLSEKDVAPEDVVFHKFYSTKSKKLPKKKKETNKDDDDATVIGGETQFVGGDDSEDEEIDDLLDGVDSDIDVSNDDEMDESEGEYEYEETSDLIKLGSPSHSDDGSVDDAEEFESSPEIQDKKRSRTKKKERSQDKMNIRSKTSKASPFVSAEDYAHLLDEEQSGDESPSQSTEAKVKGKVKGKSKARKGTHGKEKKRK